MTLKGADLDMAQIDFVPHSLRDVKRMWSGLILAVGHSHVITQSSIQSWTKFEWDTKNPAGNSGVANEIWTYLCSVTFTITIRVNPLSFPQVFVLIQHRLLLYGFQDVEKLYWPLLWLKSVVSTSSTSKDQRPWISILVPVRSWWVTAYYLTTLFHIISNKGLHSIRKS